MSPPRARFGGIDLVSADMDKSIAFYKELGVGVPDEEVYRRDGVAHHLTAKLNGEVNLDIDSDVLTSDYDPNWAAGTSGVVVIFRTDTRDDVDALHDHMVSLGHPSHLAPFDAFWGARYAMLEDPDGNFVSLMSPQDRG